MGVAALVAAAAGAALAGLLHVPAAAQATFLPAPPAPPAPPVPPALTAAARRAACDACHGADGLSRQGGVPSLAGQPRLFLENRLVLIREGLVDVPTMKGLLEGVDDAELIALARHYASLPPPPPAVPRDAARVERGARIAARMLCGSCHLSDQRGRDQIPRLAGQREDYLLATMRQFATGQARGRDTAMAEAVRGLADTDLADLAHYLATLGDTR